MPGRQEIDVSGVSSGLKLSRSAGLCGISLVLGYMASDRRCVISATGALGHHDGTHGAACGVCAERNTHACINAHALSISLSPSLTHT